MKGWRECGCYLWRTRKPHSFLGLPLIGRHNGYVGETSSRYHRDRQHVSGGGVYGATAKSWADLDPKVYPLPCLFPDWRWSRKLSEKFWILLLAPVYNVKWNGANVRRISPRRAEQQRWARDQSGFRVISSGKPVDFRTMIRRILAWVAIIAAVMLVSKGALSWR